MEAAFSPRIRQYCRSCPSFWPIAHNKPMVQPSEAKMRRCLISAVGTQKGWRSSFTHALGRLAGAALAHLVFYAGTQPSIDALPVLEGAAQHRLAYPAQKAAGDLVHERGPLIVVEHLANQGPRLAKIVVIAPQPIGAAHHRTVGFPAVVHRTGLVGPAAIAAV